MLTPLLWMICASFKSSEDVFSSAFVSWREVRSFTLDNFRTLFARKPFGRWMLNSLFLASLQTVLVVTLSSLGGFGLAKYTFRGRRPIMLMMLATMLLPGVVLLPSNYLLMYHLGWLNSYAAILAPGAVSAFGMFLFMQAMKQVPDELLHAGRVDGCSELRLWWDVALPIVRPMIGAFTLLTFLGCWNGYLWPAIVLQEPKYTLPVGMATMLGLPEFDTNYGVVMAGTLLAVLPVMLLFFAMQREFISGLATGAIKG
jgi:ABC-type glycerol-3-phosphate transport system permease component